MLWKTKLHKYYCPSLAWKLLLLGIIVFGFTAKGIARSQIDDSTCFDKLIYFLIFEKFLFLWRPFSDRREIQTTLFGWAYNRGSRFRAPPARGAREAGFFFMDQFLLPRRFQWGITRPHAGTPSVLRRRHTRKDITIILYIHILYIDNDV